MPVRPWPIARAGAGPPAPTLTLKANTRDRAAILDANGLMLASTVNVKMLCQGPWRGGEPGPNGPPILGQIIPRRMSPELEQRLATNTRWLSYEVSPRQQQQIHNANLRGIEFCDDKRRDYPQGDLLPI